MADVRNRHCSHVSCTRRSNYNVKGSKAAAYRQSAKDGMVDVCSLRCSYDSCTKRPSYNVDGCNTAAYCRQHAKHGMVDVRCHRCSHDSFTGRPRWSVLTDGAATVCCRHKSDISGGQVINFEAQCKVAGCWKRSRWGLDGKRPTHRGDHGPLDDSLACAVATARKK